MVGLTAGTPGIIAYGRTFLITASYHHRRVEVEREVVEAQLGEEPAVQGIEHTLVDSLRELAEIALIGAVVRTLCIAHQMTQRRVEADNVEVIIAACAAPHTRKQPVYELLGAFATIGTLAGKADARQDLPEMASVKHFV